MLAHAHQAGELITHLGGHPSLSIGPLLETHKHDIGDILRESLEHEAAALQLYRDLLKEVEGVSVMLEEYARNMIYTEGCTRAKSTRCYVSRGMWTFFFAIGA